MKMTLTVCVCGSGADAAEDEEVDVTSVDPIQAFCSRSETLNTINHTTSLSTVSDNI